eukprot:6205718-Pleurochrysis_carterae.AAC.11
MISAVAVAHTLLSPRCTSAHPETVPNMICAWRVSRRRRPSNLVPASRAWRTKAASLLLMMSDE